MTRQGFKKAVLKIIKEREPNEVPNFIVASNGDLVRYIADRPLPRKPIIYRGTFKMSEVWPTKN